MLWRYVYLNFGISGIDIYCVNDDKMVESGQTKHYKPATYFISDSSKVMHEFLVKYNTIESRISKSVAFIFSQPVLHIDYPCNSALAICCITLVQRYTLT